MSLRAVDGIAAAETALLLDCARFTLASDPQKPPIADRIRVLAAAPLDWDALIHCANRHGLLPLLCRQLDAVAADVCEASRLAFLRSHFQGHALRNRVMRAELLTVLRRLGEVGIRALAFKGPALAQSLYGDADLRSYSDLDVLIAWPDFACARAVVEKCGFTSRPTITPDLEEPLRRSTHALLFQKAGGAISLELHWSVVPDYFSVPLSSEALIERAMPLVLDGSEVRVPSPEDMLLILCINGVKDRWARLEAVVAVAALLGRLPALSFAGVLARADALACRRILLVGCALARDVVGAPLPVAVAARLREDQTAQVLADEVRAGLSLDDRDALAGDAGRGSFLRRARLKLFRLRARERQRDRLRHIAVRVLTPNDADWADLHLPQSLFFLHYLLRPLRLAGDSRVRGYLRKRFAQPK